MKAKVRKRKPRYKPLVKLPPLPPDQYDPLRQNIAVNGVLVPILVDSTGPKRRIIDGNHRKQIADELGYDCPEVVHEGDEEELRALARALNLARRHLTTEQKRQVIADQLRETPERTNRWIAKMLGVSHPTVASVRAEMASVGKLFQQESRVGSDGKTYQPSKSIGLVARVPRADQQTRINAVTLLHGDSRKKLHDIATGTIDTIISDPPYAEVRPRGAYGRISEKDWHSLMHEVVTECRRILKPRGSAVFILQPNARRMGEMRLWLWEFMVWAGKTWNLVEDAYWWNPAALPTRGAKREFGLMRPSVKTCIWLGSPDCYRNQNAVLWTPSDSFAAKRRAEMARTISPSGHHWRGDTITKSADERGGTTPFNLLPIPASRDSVGHPAATPYPLTDWWTRYILPPGGVLLDPFCGSGTMLAAALDNGASKVIGIDKEAKYLKMAARKIREG